MIKPSGANGVRAAVRQHLSYKTPLEGKRLRGKTEIRYRNTSENGFIAESGSPQSSCVRQKKDKKRSDLVRAVFRNHLRNDS